MTKLAAKARRVVAARAHYSCEYCGIHDDATLVPHEPDYGIGEQPDGATTPADPVYACFRCRRFKGPNSAVHDPETGNLAPLFNP